MQLRTSGLLATTKLLPTKELDRRYQRQGHRWMNSACVIHHIREGINTRRRLREERSRNDRDGPTAGETHRIPQLPKGHDLTDKICYPGSYRILASPNIGILHHLI